MPEPPAPRGPQKSSPNPLESYEVRQIDDMLITRFRGDYTLEAAKELQVLANAVGVQYGYRLLLIDVREMKDVPRETRRYLVEDQQRERRESSVAIVGAGFAMRTIATMTIRAVGTLTNIPVGLKFFETEEQARIWLEQERNRLRTLIALRKVP